MNISLASATEAMDPERGMRRMGYENVKGMLLPLPTPFDGNGGLDEGVLAQMTRYYIEQGVDALFPFGSFGMGPAKFMKFFQRENLFV